MDTGTHLMFGLGLAGLATVDPAVAGNPSLLAAVMAGTIAGSQAPDLDNLFRIGGNAYYVRHHRGITHSLPAIPLWTAVITLAIMAWQRGAGLPWLTVAGWTLLALVVHVLSDCFNSYGTLAAWPASNRRIGWGVINIFDPFLFAVHIAAIVLWAAELAASWIVFPILYGTVFLYYIWRIVERRAAVRAVKTKDDTREDGDDYAIVPTLSWIDWNVVKRKQDGSFAVGHLKGERLSWIETPRCADHPAVERSKNDQAVQAFLAVSTHPCAEVRSFSWGWEVRWSDLRYRYRQQYPFSASVVMNADYKTVGSYVGWLSEQRLTRRLRVNSY